MSARLAAGGRELWLDGPPYVTVLEALHARRRPASYLEIGVLHGDTLKLAGCPAVGVDPQPQVPAANLAGRPVTLVAATSDAFFAGHDPRALLGGPVAMAFLDGLHVFDTLLRDLINTERSMSVDGMILLHDALPRNAEMTGGDAPDGRTGRYRGLWTGDVWKLLPILRRHRPELIVRCLDAEPTGLVAITGLDPEDRRLALAYDEIVAEWEPVTLQDWGLERLFTQARVESAAAWLDAMAPFQDARPAWKRTLKRWLQRV